MDFTLTDGQKKLVSAFRTFGADTFTPERVAKWCCDQGLPDTVMKEFVDLYYETAEPDIAPDLAHSRSRRCSSWRSSPAAPARRCRSRTTCSTCRS